MATDPGFLTHVRDLFDGLGPIRVGRMFGGTALYQDDAMFAVIFGDAVYMKCDPALGEKYVDAGSTPFSYDTKTGARVIHGLMALPEDALEDADAALHWARLSLVPARAAAAQKRRRKKARR